MAGRRELTADFYPYYERILLVNAIVYATDTSENRSEAITAAQSALRDKKTIVIPTDTVYGIAADAFSPQAVEALLSAKGRSRTMPPPVLIFDEAVLPGLADEVSESATALARRFWPGALTLILYSQPSLNWDLGETQGTVALRVPNDQFAIDLLRQTGPLAVSSANKTGQPAATSAEEAVAQLGTSVEAIIDDGVRPLQHDEAHPVEALPSTIVDCTSDRLVVVREGAISVEQLREVVPEIMTKAEIEQLNRESTLARAEDRRVADSVVATPAVSSETPLSTPVGLGDGPRAAAAQQGSLNASLLAAAQSPAGVDQMRTKERYRHKIARKQATTQPLSTSDARAVVFGEAVQKNSEATAEDSVQIAAETFTPADSVVNGYEPKHQATDGVEHEREKTAE